eukprot:scaffold122569_cov22-Tisochrysis_lutea.AAC.1
MQHHQAAGTTTEMTHTNHRTCCAKSGIKSLPGDIGWLGPAGSPRLARKCTSAQGGCGGSGSRSGAPPCVPPSPWRSPDLAAEAMPELVAEG